jgi:hypothetical protein
VPCSPGPVSDLLYGVVASIWCQRRPDIETPIAKAIKCINGFQYPVVLFRGLTPGIRTTSSPSAPGSRPNQFKSPVSQGQVGARVEVLCRRQIRVLKRLLAASRHHQPQISDASANGRTAAGLATVSDYTGRGCGRGLSRSIVGNRLVHIR